jgi:hypothetical protein
VYHDIEDFPLYYDPLYYPDYHQSLFDVERAVCLWLLKGLKNHFMSCPKNQFYDDYDNVQVFDDDANDYVCYRLSFFEFKFHGVRLQLPLRCVESSLFSKVECSSVGDNLWI